MNSKILKKVQTKWEALLRLYEESMEAAIGIHIPFELYSQNWDWDSMSIYTWTYHHPHQGDFHTALANQLAENFGLDLAPWDFSIGFGMYETNVSPYPGLSEDFVWIRWGSFIPSHWRMISRKTNNNFQINFMPLIHFKGTDSRSWYEVKIKNSNYFLKFVYNITDDEFDSERCLEFAPALLFHRNQDQNLSKVEEEFYPMIEILRTLENTPEVITVTNLGNNVFSKMLYQCIFPSAEREFDIFKINWLYSFILL